MFVCVCVCVFIGKRTLLIEERSIQIIPNVNGMCTKGNKTLK